jgi:cytochrome c553
MKVLVNAVLLVIFAGSCVKKVGNKDVSFKERILPIFVSNCTMSDCHNSLSKHVKLDLTTYEGIMKAVVPGHPMLSEVYTNISGSRPSMPTKGYPKLSTQDVELIKLWINMGATNKSVELPCDSNDVTFSGSIKPMMDTWCKGCHSTTNPGKGIVLTTYEGVLACVNSERLMGSLQHGKGFTAMPQNAEALSACDIAKIAKWIRAGAPNN